MNYCPECGQNLEDNGTCSYCGYPEIKEQEPIVQPRGVFDDRGPRFGMLFNEPAERIMEENKRIYDDLKEKEENHEITSEEMLKTLEKLGFVSVNVDNDDKK